MPPGTYSVTELVPAGWTLGSIVCDDDDSTGDVGSATATIEVDAGEDVTCTFTNVAGNVVLEVDKVAGKSVVSSKGENVAFTFSVTNAGSVAFAITELEDSVYGTLDGDADCQVGTVLQPGETCEFEETFLVEPADKVDPGEDIPDHKNTFQACSILASGPSGPVPSAVGIAAVSDCVTSEVVVVAFEAAPVPSLKPTDTLADSAISKAGSGGPDGVMWMLFSLLASLVIIGAGLVIRNQRRPA